MKSCSSCMLRGTLSVANGYRRGDGGEDDFDGVDALFGFENEVLSCEEYFLVG